MRRVLILTLVLVATGCSGAWSSAAPDSTKPPAAEKGGSTPPAPALVLIGLGIGAALMVALISNSAMMPDTAP